MRGEGKGGGRVERRREVERRRGRRGKSPFHL